jgi:antitoxin CcdA
MEMETDEVVSVTCDVCKKVYSSDDIFETQEFTYIRNDCGYGSVFGDGDTISLDICQHCLKEILGKYIRTKEGE